EGDGGERRPWQNREDRGGERRPWQNREGNGGERRPWQNREDRGGERRPWQNREDRGGERRPWQNREDRGGERRQWERKDFRQDTPRKIPRYPSEPGETLLENVDSVRINRYIASTGFCSRRKADEYIKAGQVTLNGKLVEAPGEQVVPGKDQVRIAGQLMIEEQPVYILLNKPKNTITTLSDPEGRQTVIDLVRGVKERVFPVGRLDRNTTGILLLTNDGALGKRLTHPSHKVRKIYHVELYDVPRREDLQKLADGIELEDGFIQADRIDYVDDIVGPKVGIEVHSGRNRIVRRMFEHLGFEIKSLDRVAFGPLETKGVPRGEWRYLDSKEITQLRKQK
ncbi:MAG: pseudouridine synthase, partial [Bacteroidetes bacterium]|nr:pseudouridine synthase [Bacteroidota bacterium]